MESCLSYIYPHTRIQSIVGILKTTAHNAFPVVTIDKDTPQVANGNNVLENIDSSNERFARTHTLSSLTSEQKLRRTLASGAESSLLHRSRTGSEHHPASQRMNIKGKRLKSESDQDSLTFSSSAPLVSKLVINYSEQESVPVGHDDGKTLGICLRIICKCERQVGQVFLDKLKFVYRTVFDRIMLFLFIYFTMQNNN